MKTFETVTTQKVTSMVCDGCGLEASTDDGYEFQEFITINHRCGYGSIHGDGKKIETDLCQQCFADMCGDSLRRVDDNAISNATEDNEINVSSKLEYGNIFEVICLSKSEALELKNESDLRLAARDILAKENIDNKNELTIALKRVEQLWDAQYQSAEGNELHQLADLITTYEKKD
jgi:antitoxin CcdA